MRFLTECLGHDARSAVKRGRRDGKTPLHWAARNGHSAVVCYLVDSLGVPVDSPTKDGSTPLHLAVYGGHIDTAKQLLNRGADVSVHYAGCLWRWRHAEHGLFRRALQVSGLLE